MKKINWKELIITLTITILPMLIGIILYDKLPDTIAVHFNINNVADNYASKNFALFAIPAILVIVQLKMCILTDIAPKQDDRPKLIIVLKWIIPILSILVYLIIIMHSLGYDIDIRRWASIVLGLLFCLMGNYFPKMSYESSKNFIHPKPKNEKSFRIMTKTFGYSFVILGLLLIISILF